MATPAESQTCDGFETQLGTNYLGHFLLFQLLKSALLSSSSPSFNSRVVSLSSGGHRNSGVNFDDLNMRKDYDSFKAYGQASAKFVGIYIQVLANWLGQDGMVCVWP